MPLESNELEVRIIRIHPLFLALQLLSIAIPAIFALTVTIFLGSIFLTLFVILSAAFFTLDVLFCFFNTFWEVTTDRLIMHNQLFLFWENSDQCRLEHVQDEPQSQNGLISFLFDYGTIKVQTAGTSQPFVLYHAEKPKQAIAVISEMVRQLANEPKPVYTVPAPPNTNVSL